jgi:hypothetical protein
MESVLPSVKNAMQTGSRILTPEQCQKIIANLDDCIAMFEVKAGHLNVAELRAKSLLTVMRGEIIRKAMEDGTNGPFST